MNIELKSLTGLVFLYAFRMLGLFMVLPVLALYGQELPGATPLLIGLALGGYGLTQGLLQIPFGLLSDRIGRKPVIFFGLLLFLAGSLIAALSNSLYGIILGRILQGGGAVASTIMALLTDLTSEQNRTAAMAAVGGSIGLSFAIAMVAGPALASHWGLPAIFWLTAALAVGGMCILALFIPTPAKASRLTAREALPIPGLLKKTFLNGELMRLDLGIFVLHMVQMASWVSVPLILEQVLGFERGQHWWLYLLCMGGGFIAMLPFIWLAEAKRRMKPVFLSAIALLLLAELVLWQQPGILGAFVLGLFLFFMAFNLLEASLPSLVSKAAPSGSRGTAMGIYSSAQFFGAFAGGTLGGWLAYRFGLTAVFTFSALAIAGWGLAAFSMPQPRHWKSLVVPLRENERVSVDDYLGVVAGVEGLVVIPEQRLAYFKIDKDLFDKCAFERVFGRVPPL